MADVSSFVVAPLEILIEWLLARSPSAGALRLLFFRPLCLRALFASNCPCRTLPLDLPCTHAQNKTTAGQIRGRSPEDDR